MEQGISIKIILDKLMRHPLLQDISLETVVDYTIDFMRIVGVPSMFSNKTNVLQITSYRSRLPCDFHQMIQMRTTEGSKYAFRYAGDSFHLSDSKIAAKELTYRIEGDIIYTSIETGEVELSYTAISTDCDDYPIIPNNSSFTRALESFIKEKRFNILFDLGKISMAVYQNSQTQYAWNVGDCQSEFNRLTPDKAESFFNSWRTLLIRDNEHKTGFLYNGMKEKIKLQ